MSKQRTLSNICRVEMITIPRWTAIIPLSIVLIVFAYLLGQLNGLQYGLKLFREIDSGIDCN